MILEQVPEADSCESANMRAVIYYYAETFWGVLFGNTVKKLSILLVTLVNMNLAVRVIYFDWGIAIQTNNSCVLKIITPKAKRCTLMDSEFQKAD